MIDGVSSHLHFANSEFCEMPGLPAGPGRRTGNNPSRFGNSVSDEGVGGDSRLSGDHDGPVTLLVQLHELAHCGVNQVLVRQPVNACYLTYF